MGKSAAVSPAAAPSAAPAESLWSAYQRDESLIEDGAWVEVRGGARVKLRAVGSVAVRRADQKLATGRYRKDIMASKDGILDPSVQDAKNADLLADAIVVDWSGVADRAGQPMACTRANVHALVTALPSLRRELFFAASADATFDDGGAPVNRDMAEALEENL